MAELNENPQNLASPNQSSEPVVVANGEVSSQTLQSQNPLSFNSSPQQFVNSGVDNNSYAPPQPVTQQPNPVQPSRFPFWYLSGFSVLSAKKGVALVSPGRLTVSDLKSGQELYSFNLTPDLKMSRFMGYARITYLNGQRKSVFKRQSVFYFYNPVIYPFFYYVAFLGRAKAKDFVAQCKQAAGVADL